LVAVALVASVIAIAFRIGDVLGGNTYTESLVTMQRPMIVDPLFGRADPSVTDVGALTYRGLMKLDDQAAPVPDLASSVKVSGDGLTYTIQLSGALWSDGRGVNTGDVVNTVRVITQPGYGDAALAAAWANAGLQASGDVLTVKLPSPHASFEAALAQTPILPLAGMSTSQLANLASQDTSPLPTSGPYRIAASDGSSLTLTANKNFKPQAKIGMLKFRLFGTFSDALADFRSGSDGIVARTPADRAKLLALHRGSTEEIKTFQFDDLIFNERTPGLNDQVVRAAVSELVDRAAIIAQPLQGQAVPQVGAIPEGISWALPAAPEKPSDNRTGVAAATKTAAAALAADGWVRGADGVLARSGESLRFRIAVPDVPWLQASAKVIAGSLNSAGFAVSVDVVPGKNFVNQVLNSGDFEMAVVDWANGPDPDISGYWRSNATPPEGFNVSGGPTDVFLDQALDSLATVSDLNGRRAAAATVVADLGADIPAVFLDTPTVTVGLAPGLKAAGIPPTGGSGARFASVVEWSKG
jgi:peptide/nickel transport system substrate-binding protein